MSKYMKKIQNNTVYFNNQNLPVFISSSFIGGLILNHLSSLDEKVYKQVFRYIKRQKGNMACLTKCSQKDLLNTLKNNEYSLNNIKNVY